MGASFCHHDTHQLTIISTLPRMRATSLERTHHHTKTRRRATPYQSGSSGSFVQTMRRRRVTPKNTRCGSKDVERSERRYLRILDNVSSQREASKSYNRNRKQVVVCRQLKLFDWGPSAIADVLLRKRAIKFRLPSHRTGRDEHHRANNFNNNSVAINSNTVYTQAHRHPRKWR